MNSIPATKLLYFDDSYLFEETATVLEHNAEESFLILDQTIFYPQGGGQPTDLGSIESSNSTFNIHKVTFNDGHVIHSGAFDKEAFKPGEKVILKVDSERRLLHSRIHTAGHLLDVAMIEIGQTLMPTKGYHFADSPYVEYEGIIEADKREEIKQLLEDKVNEIIQVDNEVKQFQVEKSELSQYCQFVPDTIPADKPSRVVIVAGDKGCPCGGTHVKQLKEINSMQIKKIKSKRGNTRISYQVS